ncbi:chaperone protein dnaJ 72 isoform X2 [Typha latifolia]|uniref:chaperone protein dnaJ 72 isoform X2 n=1 Tax=Typha latifolia TaxID=4733 RepID=UPI003C300C66
MDHYKTLGVRRDASKEEIKEAFRSLALRFHPDKHSQSSKEVRDGASARFKQASEAYEVLIDERKKSKYDLGFSSRRGASSSSSYYYGARQYGYGYGYGGGGSSRRPPQRDGGVGMDMEFLLRFVTRKGFLLNVAFARNRLKKQWSPLKRLRYRRRTAQARKECPHKNVKTKFYGCLNKFFST